MFTKPVGGEGKVCGDVDLDLIHTHINGLLKPSVSESYTNEWYPYALQEYLGSSVSLNGSVDGE